MRLEKIIQGQYDVYADNGQRVGVVSGGAGLWAAETRAKHLGYRASKVKAGQALLAHAGLRDMADQMSEVIANTKVLTSYVSDFNIDLDVLSLWNGAVDFIWVVRPSGTHLVPLQMPRSEEEINAIYDTFRREPHQSFLVYHVDMHSLKLRPQRFADLPGFASRAVGWDVNRNFVTWCNKTIGDITEVPDTRFGTFGDKPSGGIVITVSEMPDARRKAILAHLGEVYVIRKTGTLFAKLHELQIVFDKQVVYSKRAEIDARTSKAEVNKQPVKPSRPVLPA